MSQSRPIPPSSPEGPPRRGLLAQARAARAGHRLADVCALEDRILEAPAAERAELAVLVGTTLVDLLCGGRAAALYVRVLEVCERPAEKALLLLKRARVFQELSEVGQGLACLEHLSPWMQGAVARELGPERDVVEAALASVAGDQSRAITLARGALDITPRDDLAVEAAITLALCALRQGRMDQAGTWAELAVSRAQAEGGAPLADALRTQAVIAANRNEFMQAILACRDSLKIYRTLQVPRGLFRGYLSLGISYLAQGELDNAELFLGKCKEIAENGEDPVWRTRVLGRLGNVHLVRGEPEQALASYREDARLTARLDSPVGRGHPEMNLGNAILALGRLEEARKHYERALECYLTVKDPVGQGQAHLALARCHARRARAAEGTPRRDGDPRGHLPLALHHLWNARDHLDPLHRPELDCHCDVAEALIRVASGELDEALSRYRAGVAVLERLGDVASATHAAFWMGEILESTGRKPQAVTLYNDAIRSAEMYQFQGLRRVLLKRLDRLDENAVVDRSLKVSAPPRAELERRRITTDSLHGSHPTVREVRRLVGLVAPTNVPVLIRGETGTGKELVARAIHDASAVGDKELVVLNCGAIPRDLVESELFGHARGSFTGAIRSHVGCFEQANGGTVFLDEIGDLPLDAQVKLLRFLATGEVRRVGESTPIYVDVRVIAATHRDLRAAVAREEFREDLFYRLAIFEIRTPPLRERITDIPELVSLFLASNPLAVDRGIQRVSPAAMDALLAWRWPGNVRELENAIRHASVVCPGPTLERVHLPVHLLEETGEGGAEPPEARRPDPAAQVWLLEQVEQDHIRRVLDLCEGNQVEAARMLGIHRNTLGRRLKEMGEA